MSKQSANAVQAVLDANRECLIGFDDAKFMKQLRAMSKADSGIAKWADKAATASLEFVRDAETMRIASAKEGATDIDKAYGKQVQAMLPRMFKEGLYCEQSESGTYKLTGTGRNVVSTARGFCQYDDFAEVTVTTDSDGNEVETVTPITAATLDSYGKCRAAVIARRALDRTAEQVALADAKLALNDSLSAIKKLALKGNDVDLIQLRTLELEVYRAEIKADADAQHEANIKAEHEKAEAAKAEKLATVSDAAQIAAIEAS